jgi:hypothetical protein
MRHSVRRADDTMRLRQVVLAARDLAGVRETLADVLGLGAPFADPGVAEFGLHNAVFPVGQTFLEIVSPVRDGTAAGRFIQRRGGDGGYMVIVQSSDLAADRRRVKELGVRIVWEIEFPDIATIHLHPRDVGGAILSIDAADPPASWRWAGPGWESRSRADVTTAVVGVEFVSADPAALARRWSEVLGLPTVVNGDGIPTIPLEGGSLRFEASGESDALGIAAFDIEAVDPAAILARARGRELETADDGFTIAGTRIRLRAA